MTVLEARLSRRALDIMGNSVSTPEEKKGIWYEPECSRDLVTKRDYQASEARFAHRERRRQRGKLQKVAASILQREAVCRCGRYVAEWPDRHNPSVTVRRADDGRAHITGLVTCKSVWMCPVCAAKISEGRRVEVAGIVKAHHEKGGTVYMATLTVPHTAFQRCSDLKTMVAETWRKAQGTAGWKRAKERAGVIGAIRSLEVTHGANGWHPHLHILVFCDGRDLAAERRFGTYMYDRWRSLIAEAGGGRTTAWANYFEAVANPEEAGEYVAKWGPDAELTKANMKLGNGANRSPWQILTDIATSETPADIKLFREYALAFKGARQLTWTKGLREAYWAEADDEELATAEPVKAVDVAQLSKIAFEMIRDRGLIYDLLEATERHGAAGVVAFCERYGIKLWHIDWLNYDVGPIKRSTWPPGSAAGPTRNRAPSYQSHHGR